MDQEKLAELFDDKYQKLLGITYQQWFSDAPKSEDEAYKRLDEIDKILNETYEAWFEATGTEKDQLEDMRDKLKTEYDLIEELFNLEALDKNW